MVYEDEHDSLRRGWLYDEEDGESAELPGLSIERASQQQHQPQKPVTKKHKSKAKPRHSMKLVKSGPMARTFFR